MTFLQDTTDQLKGLGLELVEPETKACRDGMGHILQALADTKVACRKYLLATSKPEQFQKLIIFIKIARDYSYKIITVLGDPEQHLEPIDVANNLLDAIDIHIRLRRHVDFLEKHPGPMEQDLNALPVSMQRIRDLLDDFSTKAREVFNELKHEDLLS